MKKSNIVLGHGFSNEEYIIGVDMAPINYESRQVDWEINNE